MTDSYCPPPPPSAADHQFNARRAAARRLAFLEQHGLRGIAGDESSVIRMCGHLRDAWDRKLVESGATRRHVAIPALDRITTKYAGTGRPLPMFLESHGSGFSVYARVGTDRPVLLAQHLGELGPGEIRELSDLAAAGFGVRVTPERWVARVGFRVMAWDPTQIDLDPPAKPDPEYRPGPSVKPRHVALRANAPETVRTPSHQPIEVSK